MARKYDSRTTIFSPEGRLYQVEYAMEAISHAWAAIGILAKDGVVLVAEKKFTSKLLDPPKHSEKLYKIDSHLACAVAGITADANILINYARLSAQRYTFQFQEPQPVELLVQTVCDLKQGYTQYGGLRPFGVSFLYAGWDRHFGFQLYHSDPSGNYAGWKGTAIGNNSPSAQNLLKQEYDPELNVEGALKLAVKVMCKIADATGLDNEKIECSTLKLDEEGNPFFRCLTPNEITDLLKSADLHTETPSQAS